MKKLFALLFLLVAVSAHSQVITLINDEAVTSSNDTLTSSWVYIGNANYVELFNMVDDTMHVKYYVDYSVGGVNGTYYATVAVDSIKTTGTASTMTAVGKTLRGYGTSAISNLIIGANYIRLRAYNQSGSETTGIFKSYVYRRD